MAKRKIQLFKGELPSVGNQAASWILQNLPFILFLGFLATIYIANAHYAEKNVREIQLLQRDIKDLRREYNSLKAEIMYNQKLTEMQRKVEPMGLEAFRNPPQRIIVKED
ncbi:MAG: FtsL-like putative cell division protein [Saprospiraceae bacterium]